MPAMHYRIRWPDSTESTCYSPSLVIKDFFAVNTSYALTDFLTRVREATRIADDRVRAKFGFACSRASDQLGVIEAQARGFTEPDAVVQILAFEDIA